MTDYRIVARHVRYWRGSVHRWSTVWRFTGSISTGNIPTAVLAIHDLEQKVGYPGVTTHQAGLYEVALYDHATGGVPLNTTTYFDYTNPSAWINYSGTAWASPFGAALTNAEVAVVVEWPAGVSTTGKPVRFRKWFHTCPTTAAVTGANDISSADLGTIASTINTQVAIVGGLGAPMGNGSRLAATSCNVLGHYGNHQMPRGRRRKALVTASGRYTGPSLVVPNAD